MSDPITTAARREVEDGFATLRRAIEGLSPEALNWEPTGDETNSIAVLCTHAARSTPYLLALATGRGEPDRDRDSEFAAVAGGPDPLLELIDGSEGECRDLLGGGGFDWGAKIRRTRSTGEAVELSAAQLLLHAVTHLRGHADEAALTRHLWSARG